MSELILRETFDDILLLTLNRPDKRNAINMDMFEQFATAVTQVNRTPGIRMHGTGFGRRFT